MASKSIFAFVILLVLVLCLFLMRAPSDCSTIAYGCLGAATANVTGTKEILNTNRKVLSVLKNKKTTLKGRVQGSSNGMYGDKSLSWELRKVPSGPDPLHHNGDSPKPETP